MYTFSLKWRINDVPITCYLATHAYFIFYHSLTNLILRRLRRALAALPSAASVAITCLVILVLAYVTAFMETFTDPQFLADAAQREMTIKPVPAEEVTRLLTQAFATRSDIIARLRSIYDRSQ